MSLANPSQITTPMNTVALAHTPRKWKKTPRLQPGPPFLLTLILRVDSDRAAFDTNHEPLTRVEAIDKVVYCPPASRRYIAWISSSLACIALPSDVNGRF